MMNKEVMASIAQLEDFDEQLYKVSGKTDDPAGSSEKYLIATSEQPICAYHKNEWIDEKTLPLRYAGISVHAFERRLVRPVKTFVAFSESISLKRWNNFV